MKVPNRWTRKVLNIIIKNDIYNNHHSLPASFYRAQTVVTNVYNKYVKQRHDLEYQIVTSKIDPKLKLELLQSDLFKFKDFEKMGRDIMVMLTMVTSSGKITEEYLPEFQKAFRQLRLDTCAFSVEYNKTKKRFEELNLVAKQLEEINLAAKTRKQFYLTNFVNPKRR